MQIQNKENNPDSSVHDYLLKQCQHGYRNLFQAIVVAGTWNLHEKIASNDCLINFKYTHEFVTNYDFDELIIPHHSNMGDMQVYFDNMSSSKASVCDHNPVKFNLYDHAVKMLNKHNDAAVLSLDHVMMAPFSEDLNEFFSNMERKIENYTDFKESLTLTFKNTVFEIVNHGDIVYSKQLVKLYKTVNFINRNLVNKEKIVPNFNRAVAFKNPTRLGKSLYNTNLCEMINVHNADIFAGLTAVVPYRDSFASHFRDDYEDFFKEPTTYSIRFIYIDVEYYHFLLIKYYGLDCYMSENK